MNSLKMMALAFIVAFEGCASTPSGPARIDGSSPKACDASWKGMEASLNSQQKQQLDFALLLIGSTKQHRLGTMASSPGISPNTIREEIDGKDFAEIIAFAKATGTKITDIERPAGR